jgi:hypothetical protein
VPLILYDFKGLSNYSTEPSYYDIVYFLLHGVNGGRITSSCGAQRNCRTFRRSSSSCAHNTVSSLTSSISSYRINWWSFSSRHFDLGQFLMVHRWRHKHPRQRSNCSQQLIGYLVSGPLSDTVTTSQSSSYHISAVHCDDINRLWSLEVIGIHPDNENAYSTASYQAEYISFENNQYTARLPWKKEHSDLPSNYSICQRRTRHTVKSLLQKPQLSSSTEKSFAIHLRQVLSRRCLALEKLQTDVITFRTLLFTRIQQPLLFASYTIAHARLQMGQASKTAQVTPVHIFDIDLMCFLCGLYVTKIAINDVYPTS